eukprot:Skav228879  [mRNA]  locus=scaffold2395:119310:123437:+ [translate_table: standard]
MGACFRDVLMPLIAAAMCAEWPSVYDLPRSVAETRGKSNATLRLSVTPIYGNPVFEVRKDDEDGAVLFNSLPGGGGDTWRLAMTNPRNVSGAHKLEACLLTSCDLIRQIDFCCLFFRQSLESELVRHDVYLFVPARNRALGGHRKGKDLHCNCCFSRFEPQYKEVDSPSEGKTPSPKSNVKKSTKYRLPAH